LVRAQQWDDLSTVLSDPVLDELVTDDWLYADHLVCPAQQVLVDRDQCVLHIDASRDRESYALFLRVHNRMFTQEVLGASAVGDYHAIELPLLTKNLLILLIAAPVHGVCMLLCAKDARFFDLTLLWGRTRLPALLGYGEGPTI